jgi:CRISPR/Cas system-associated protein Csx1
MSDDNIKDSVKLDALNIALNLTSVDDYFVETVLDIVPMEGIMNFVKISDPEVSFIFLQILSNTISHSNNLYAEKAHKLGILDLVAEKCKSDDSTVIKEVYWILVSL